MTQTRHQKVVTIACVNKATIELGVDFDKLTAALQKCYDEHFLPVWGYPVRLYNTSVAAPSDWKIMFFNDTRSSDYLGYHYLTDNGQPISKVYVGTALKSHEPVSVVASHELFEMVIDPLANLWAENEDGVLFGYEICDPVEEDTFEVNRLKMCNFVYPTWFEPFDHPPDTRFDHLGLLNAPFSLRPGGYTIKKGRGKRHEIFGSRSKKRRFQEEDRKNHRCEYRKKGLGSLTKSISSQN